MKVDLRRKDAHFHSMWSVGIKKIAAGLRSDQSSLIGDTTRFQTLLTLSLSTRFQTLLTLSLSLYQI